MKSFLLRTNPSAPIQQARLSSHICRQRVAGFAPLQRHVRIVLIAERHPMWGAKLQLAKIERLRTGSGDRLRSLRLRAITECPDAFGTTLEEAIAEPLENWEAQVQQLATFVATAAGRDIGLARGVRHDHASETGYLLSMWVSPEARRQGIAADLIDAVVDWARTEGLKSLVLDVAENNLPALELYTDQGFVPNGVLGTLPHPRDHIREIQLELRL